MEEFRPGETTISDYPTIIYANNYRLQLIGARIFRLGVKWHLFKRWGNVKAFHTSSTPLNRVDHSTPIVGASGILH